MRLRFLDQSYRGRPPRADQPPSNVRVLPIRRNLFRHVPTPHRLRALALACAINLAVLALLAHWPAF